MVGVTLCGVCANATAPNLFVETAKVLAPAAR